MIVRVEVEWQTPITFEAPSYSTQRFLSVTYIHTALRRSLFQANI